MAGAPLPQEVQAVNPKDLTPHERQVLSRTFDIPDHHPDDTMNRADHLAWAKQRALEYVDTRPDLALRSLFSDFGKHTELAGLPLEPAVTMLAVAAGDSAAEMRRFIEGFN